MKKRSSIAALFLALVLLTGCSEEALRDLEEAGETLEDKPGVVTVQAPSGQCWSGAIGNSTKEACGTKSFDVKEDITVANVQKLDAGRWKLTLILEIEGVEVDRGSTTARYGVVTVSE